MIEIGKTIVSKDVFEKKFLCNLNACKGVCCVEGEAGAPLTEDELEILECEFENIKPFLREEGIAAIAKQGTHVIDTDGEPVTPLIEEKECAFTVINDQGIAECGIEKTWLAGATGFQKPLSCHLYPVRITHYKKFDAVNYHHWDICKPACECGSKLGMPAYKFTKVALIRKYGEKWYEELESMVPDGDEIRKII